MGRPHRLGQLERGALGLFVGVRRGWVAGQPVLVLEAELPGSTLRFMRPTSVSRAPSPSRNSDAGSSAADRKPCEVGADDG